MPPVSTDFGEGNGEMCAFQRRFEALLGQIPSECEPIAAAYKMEKLRFVHAVMVMANSDGKRGERMEKRHKTLLNPPAQTDTQNGTTEGPKGPANGQPNATQTEPSRTDPIGQAVKVLRETTEMLEQMLTNWRDEGRRRGTDALWHGKGRTTDEAMASQPTDRKTEGPTETKATEGADQRAQPTAQNTRQPPHLPMSAKISFPSELRWYRMGKEQHE